jgi:GAF domain-containing protein
LPRPGFVRQGLAGQVSHRSGEVSDGLRLRKHLVYPGLQPHGHYCVPITCGELRIGLLNVSVREGHSRSPIEERFLNAVADVLVGVIERKKVEEPLQKTEERFRLAVRGTGAGIWDRDLHKNTAYDSPQNMLSYQPGED